MRNSALLAIVIATLLGSCGSDIVVGDNQSMGGTWDQGQVVQFQLPELDSLKTYNVFFHIRNTNDYPYNNLYLIASMEFPHGKTIKDTLEYRMANPDGTWLGTGIGSVKESKLWYKEGVRFFEPGSYSLRVEHAMRNNGEVQGVSTLPGITEVGYSIEKSPEQ